MPGLLDFLVNDPGAQLGVGLLAAGGPSTTPMNVGQRVQMALQGVSAQNQNALKTKLLESQIAENNSQNALRQSQIDRQARQDAYYLGTPGTAPAPAASTSLGGAPAGAVLKAAVGKSADAPDPPQGKFAEWSKQYNIPVDALIADYYSNSGKGIAEMIAKRGTPNMKVANGYAYDENKLQPGFMPSFTTTPDGKSVVTQIGANGMPVVSVPQGALDSFNAYQGAQANFKPIKVYNPATQREEYTTEGAVVGGAPRQPMARTGNPMIDAVIQTESGGNPNAVSPKGAQGVMQVMPSTNAAPGFGVTPARNSSEAERTRVGQEYLTALNQKYQNPTLAAIAYNWGPGNTDMWLKSGGDYSKLPAETKNYVSAVMTRTAVNGLGGQGATTQPAAFAAGPSANEAASAKAREATASSIGSKAGDLLKESADAANSATQSVASAQRMVQAIDSDKVLSGPGASLRLRGLQLASVLGIPGKDDAEKIANTRQAVQEMAKLTLEGRKQMSGQGAITNQESALAERATSGSIDDLTAPEIRQLAQAAERSGRWKYAQHEAKMNAMSQDPAMAGNVALYKAAPMPAAASAPAAAPVATMRFNPATGKIEQVK